MKRVALLTASRSVQFCCIRGTADVWGTFFYEGSLASEFVELLDKLCGVVPVNATKTNPVSSSWSTRLTPAWSRGTSNATGGRMQIWTQAVASWRQMAAQPFGGAARNCAGGPEMLLSRCPKGAPRLCSGLTKKNLSRHTRRPHTDPLQATFPDDTRSLIGCTARNTLVPPENSPSHPQMNRLSSVSKALCRRVADSTFCLRLARRIRWSGAGNGWVLVLRSRVFGSRCCSSGVENTACRA